MYDVEGVKMRISYSLSSNQWAEYPELIQYLIIKNGVQKVCDVGGGANPILPYQFIEANHLDCTVLDISSIELQKAPDGYKKLVQDIEAEDIKLRDEFDLVITKMMAEHVRNGKLFHQNIYKLLRPGGIAVHYFPTLYSIPFVVNKIMPERLSSFLLDVFLPRNRHQLGKFRAYYSWCFGPTTSMLSMLSNIGYSVVEYRAFFGHVYYDKIPLVRDLHWLYSRFLVQFPNPYLTSFGQVILQKPN